MTIDTQDLLIWFIGLVLIWILSPKEGLTIMAPIIFSFIWSVVCILLLWIIDISISDIIPSIEFTFGK